MISYRCPPTHRLTGFAQRPLLSVCHQQPPSESLADPLYLELCPLLYSTVPADLITTSRLIHFSLAPHYTLCVWLVTVSSARWVCVFFQLVTTLRFTSTSCVNNLFRGARTRHEPVHVWAFVRKSMFLCKPLWKILTFMYPKKSLSWFWQFFIK